MCQGEIRRLTIPPSLHVGSYWKKKKKEAHVAQYSHLIFSFTAYDGQISNKGSV